MKSFLVERCTECFAWMSGIFIVAILAYILGDIFVVSMQEMSWSFLTDSPYSGGRKGGVFPIIVSTLMIVGVSFAVVLPVGGAVALYLAESNSSQMNLVRKGIEILSGVPSIVFGLFGNALFSVYFGLGFSILSGGLTLAVMSLPLFVVTMEKGVRSIPQRYYLVSDSLGMSKLSVLKFVILPCAMPAIVVGMVLSIGRSLAETAALIFTSGYVDRMPESIFDSGRSLSIHIYDLSMNVPGGDVNAYKSSMVLIVMILGINSLLNLSLSAWHRKRIAT